MTSVGPRTAATAGLAVTVAAAGFLAAPPAQAIVGPAAAGQDRSFTTRLAVGGTDRACSGALVDPHWVLTAASCFADDLSNPTAPAPGAPKKATTATIGRPDLTTTTGQVRTVVELVPRTDRDLVLARLDKPVTDITPVELATAAPVAGEGLISAGFGRTSDEWSPLKMHTGSFSSDSLQGAELGLTGRQGNVICAGDAGGPLLREKDGQAQLAAINSRSWQAGCFGSDPSETRTNAVGTRVDDVADWVAGNRLATMHREVTNVVTSADFNGDGRPDVAAVLKDGNLHAFYTAADGSLRYGRELWKHDGSWRHKTRIFGGDFNGDGEADIAAINAAGFLDLYAGTASGRLDGAVRMWQDESWGKFPSIARHRARNWTRDGLVTVAPSGRLYAYPTGANGVLTGSRTEVWHDDTWDKKLISTSDYNGDRRNDIAAISQKGQLDLYTGNVAGTFDYANAMWPDASWGSFPVIMGGDFNGDGKADIAAVNSSGSLFLYPGDGKGQLATRSPMWPVTG